MKNLLCVLFVFLMIQNGYGQLATLQNIADGSPLTANYPGISGSPYFNDFLSGEILLANGQVYAGLIRYNPYSNQIEYKQDYEVYSLVERQVQGFKFNIAGNIQSFEKGLLKRAGQTLFYELLQKNDNFSLIKVYNVSVGQDTNAASYGSVLGKAFIHSKALYICQSDNCEEIKGNKSFLSILTAEEKASAEEVVKKNKLNLKKEKDAIFLMQELK